MKLLKVAGPLLAVGLLLDSVWGQGSDCRTKANIPSAVVSSGATQLISDDPEVARWGVAMRLRHPHGGELTVPGQWDVTRVEIYDSDSRKWRLLEAFTVVYEDSQLHEICRKVDAGRPIESKVTFDVVQAVKNVPDTGYGAKARTRVFAQGVCRCQGQNAAVVFETRTDAFEVNLALRSNQKRKDSDKW